MGVVARFRSSTAFDDRLSKVDLARIKAASISDIGATGTLCPIPGSALPPVEASHPSHTERCQCSHILPRDNFSARNKLAGSCGIQLRLHGPPPGPSNWRRFGVSVVFHQPRSYSRRLASFAVTAVIGLGIRLIGQQKRLTSGTSNDCWTKCCISPLSPRRKLSDSRLHQRIGLQLPLAGFRHNCGRVFHRFKAAACREIE